MHIRETIEFASVFIFGPIYKHCLNIPIAKSFRHTKTFVLPKGILTGSDYHNLKL